MVSQSPRVSNVLSRDKPYKSRGERIISMPAIRFTLSLDSQHKPEYATEPGPLDASGVLP